MKPVNLGTYSKIVALVTVGVLLAAWGTSAQDRPDANQSADAAGPPLSDSRLTVHTLLREDIFAGFLANDMKRFARGEKNIELLLDQRQNQKANLLAWKGGAILFRAVRANEDHHKEECQRLYRQAKDLFAQAAEIKTGNDGVAAVTGGSCVLFADRLPAEDRAAAWALAYDAYSALNKQQSSVLDKLPVHFRGELLAGLAKSAARTGHDQEATEALDKILVMLPDTTYASAAAKWKENPKSASNPSITCQSCHEPGRLKARIEALNKK